MGGTADHGKVTTESYSTSGTVGGALDFPLKIVGAWLPERL